MDPHESFIFAHMTTKIGRNPLLAIVAQKEIIRTFEGAVPKIITMRLINFSQNSPGISWFCRKFSKKFQEVDKQQLRGKWFFVENEVEILEMSSHPHICQLLDAFKTDTRYYLVFEHAEVKVHDQKFQGFRFSGRWFIRSHQRAWKINRNRCFTRHCSDCLSSKLSPRQKNRASGYKAGKFAIVTTMACAIMWLWSGVHRSWTSVSSLWNTDLLCSGSAQGMW